MALTCAILLRLSGLPRTRTRRTFEKNRDQSSRQPESELPGRRPCHSGSISTTAPMFHSAPPKDWIGANRRQYVSGKPLAMPAREGKIEYRKPNPECLNQENEHACLNFLSERASNWL